MLHYSCLLALLAAVCLCSDRESEIARRHKNLPFYDSFSKLGEVFKGMPSLLKGTAKERAKAVRQFQQDRKMNANAGQSEVCTFSMDGYHVITTPHYISPEIGAAECARFGWQYAVVPDDDWHPAAWTITNCTYLSIGVRSYNGFMTTGCQLMQGAGGFLLSQDTVECGNLLNFPLLCKEGPVEVSHETVFEDYTAFTTTIVTVTTPNLDSEVTTDVKKGNQLLKAMTMISKKELAAKRKQVHGKLQGGYDVCQASHGGLHMVYDPFSHTDSFQVCADLGMFLADIDSANSADVLSLFDECQPYDVIFNVNSYAGIASGLCRLAYVLPWYNVWGLIGVNPSMCFFLDAPVICQDAPLTATETMGTAVESTVFMTTTQVEYVPVATEVVTETQFA